MLSLMIGNQLTLDLKLATENLPSTMDQSKINCFFLLFDFYSLLLDSSNFPLNLHNI